MATNDDPNRSSLRLLPKFRQPNPDQPLPPDPSSPLQETTSPVDPLRESLNRAAGGSDWPDAHPRPSDPTDAPATRTGSSSTGEISVHKATPKEAAALVAGLLGLTIAGVAFAIRWRTGRALRRPTKTQTSDIATPLASLVLRHVDLPMWSEDIADLLSFGAATGAYLNDGPLLDVDVDPGIPPDLQGEQP